MFDHLTGPAPAARLEALLDTATAYILAHTLVILLAVLTLLFLSDLILRLKRIRDPRCAFLASFLGVEPAAVIPLPPATALWQDWSRTNLEANPATELPEGSGSLQGSYLVAAHGGFTVVAVHNFEKVKIYPGVDDPELRDTISGTLAISGRIQPARFAVEVEQDAIRRANILEKLMLWRFGYEGRLKVCTLLRDAHGYAPEYETDVTAQGEVCERFTFEEESRIRRFIENVEEPVSLHSLPAFRRYFTSWPGRQTPRWRLALRLTLALGCAAIIALTGETSITAELFESL